MVRVRFISYITARSKLIEYNGAYYEVPDNAVIDTDQGWMCSTFHLTEANRR